MSDRLPSLRDEIRQTRPFRSAGHEAVLALLRTTDVLGRFFAQVLEPHGITMQQYNVLRILRGAGPEGLPTLAIGERMVERTPGVTRLLDRLEARGWVRRQRAEDDRRRVDCFLTDAGRELLARLDRPIETADRDAVAALTEREQRTLIRLLAKIRASHD